ncbi:TolB family protein [Sediminibacterium ginsengisoli]|nr:PD40 domain-containing protein [Sediminibacterium ginsengisoli]
MKLSIIVIACFLTSSALSAQEAAKPVMFAPGIISAGSHELNASFTKNEKTVFYSRTTTGWGLIAIYTSNKQGNSWSQPQPAPFTGQYRDTDPFVAPDGKRLYFMSDRPLAGEKRTEFDYKLFYVQLENGKITGEPQPFVLPVSAGMKPQYPSVAANGNAYYFSREGRDADIYVSKLLNGQYQLPEKLSFNTPAANDFDPIISADEKFIVFVSSTRTGGLGGNDLWISYNENGTWTEPRNLGPAVNTPGPEGAPGLSADNKTLYFSASRETPATDKPYTPAQLESLFNSYRNGLPNIYMVSLKEWLPKS